MWWFRNKDIEGQFPKDVGGDHSVNERKTPNTILDPKDKERERQGKGLDTDAWKIAKRYLWPYFLIDILAILPIPQVVILPIFSEMRSTKSSIKVQLLNSIVLFQYVPRVSQIYLSCNRLIRNYWKFGRIILVKVSLNFMLYILAGHALGASWYFFSTQRLAACWHIACDNHSECVGSSFNCDHNFKNISFIDDICPINIANTTSFNFGIFLEALQSGVLESTDFPQKLLYSFWWGMRNLSSLGQNLQTSSYIWENCFAFGISIFGLILFLYFMMGYSQMYMQWKAKKEQEERMRRERLKILSLWMSKYGFDIPTKDRIIGYVGQNYEADEDVYVETLLPRLPPELQSVVKRHICLNLLKNLDIIKDNVLARQEQLLLKICDSLKPMFYNEHCCIVRETDPIDKVLLVTDGIVRTYTSNNGDERLEKGQYIGGELLEWVMKPTSNDMRNLSILPVSSKTLKTHTKVEIFALEAHDLKQILGPEQLSLVQRFQRSRQFLSQAASLVQFKKTCFDCLIESIKA
ncbi:cyclic nucleotide-gated ion channel 1-like isoform X3 [Quercus robur]|uniref:cyclic nucleotide-gated ion channel 1-like isoform X3 n=1 Tax=Quercus robur TaxID=38942 RepID=UPI00216319EA|nr:cyclic nucleotide-gated ion channel 1-like isoform X3 [Quercus robur]